MTATLVGSLFASIAASACCLGPVLFATLGIGAFGASAARLGPYRPFFLGAAGVMLAAAFSTTYRATSTTTCDPQQGCAPPSTRVKVVLWITAVLIALIAAFPIYVAGADQDAPKPRTAVVVLTIEGMTCAGCEAAVTLAATRVTGVHAVIVSYRKGTADVRYDPDKTTPEAIARAITGDSGFRATVPKKRQVRENLGPLDDSAGTLSRLVTPADTRNSEAGRSAGPRAAGRPRNRGGTRDPYTVHRCRTA